MSTLESIEDVKVMKEVEFEKEDSKLSFGEKFALTINGATGTFHNQMIQVFLLFFYTDMLHISAAYVAVLFLVVRIADAFMAPLLGVVIDKVTTPWGKYKPWYLCIGALIGVFGWLSFTDFNLNSNAKIIYISVTYFLYSTFRTIETVPGGALGPAVTKRLDDRISMNQLGYFLMMICAMTVSVAVQPLYKILGGGNDVKGFSIIMGAVCVITMLITTYQAFTIKEKYVVQHKKDDKAPSIMEMLKAIVSNKTALIVYAYTFGINLSSGIRSAITIYFMKYYFHNESLMSIMAVISLLPTMIGVALSTKVTKRIGIKKNLVIGIVVSIVSTIIVIALPSNQIGIIIYIVVSAIAGLISGISTPATGTMMPAAMDYTEWKTGKNINAFMGSFNGFLQTLATALSGTIAAAALAIIGYVAGAEQQTASTVFGLKVLMSLLPAAAALITLVVLKFDLTEEKQAQITKDLAERRANAAQNATN